MCNRKHVCYNGGGEEVHPFFSGAPSHPRGCDTFRGQTFVGGPSVCGPMTSSTRVSYFVVCFTMDGTDPNPNPNA